MPRLGHKKSRLGCRQCKARHVKCDELKPCSNCSRHGVPCSLVAWDSNTPQPPTAQAASSAAAAHRRTNQSERPIAGSSSSSTPPARLDAQTTQRTTLSEASSPESPPDQYPFLSRFIQKREPSPANLWLRDLELLHHWAIEAYPDFTGRPPIQQIWQVDIPKYAVSYAYLMHEVLAFSAFHKAHKAQDPETRREYYTFGIHHQDCAIRGVRESIPKIIPDHAIGIVACSTLLTISVFASSGLEAEMTPSPGAIDGLINNFQLIQGMGNVLALAHTIVQDSFLMPMYHDSPIVTPPQPLLAEFLQHIPNLIAFIQSRHDLSEEERTVYMTTVESFSPVLAISMPPKLDNREIRFLFYWPLHLDPRFINYVRLRKQPAVAILMHYAVIFLAAEHKFWFLKGWGPRVMNECYEIIDQSWLPAVQWPLTFLNSDSTWRVFPHISERQDSVRSAEDMYQHQPQVQIPHRDTPPGQSASHESAEGSSPPQKFQFHYIGPEQRPVIGITSVNSNPHPVADKD